MGEPCTNEDLTKAVECGNREFKLECGNREQIEKGGGKEREER